ncbi:MAG: Gfo/Idh/MocA family oxidoreductase, partial [Victivallales bacterium]|nr:Gfo/Idh/MocA family oxidoreductase [Victivallales bacterium]
MKAKKLKVGIVGLGRIAIAHAAEIAKYPDKFQWVAAADNDPDRLVNAVPSQLADTKKYASLEAMLKHPGLDMVTIATRHPDHVPMALKVLEAGKIALVEKPIATSTDELKVLLAAGAKHPNKLFFHHNRRFEPQFMKIKELC